MKTKQILALVTCLSVFAVLWAMPGTARANPGDLYATTGQRICTYAPDGTFSILVDGISRPRGLAFDALGNLFCSTLDTAIEGDDLGRILKFVAPYGTYGPFTTCPDNCMDNPEQIAFDSHGNLFAASAGQGNSPPSVYCSVYKIDQNGTVTPFAIIGDPNGNIPHQLFGAVIDRQDNLFVADGYGVIYKITPNGSVCPFATVQPTANTGPSGLAFDAAGYLFVSTSGDVGGSIIKISPDGTQQTPFATISSFDTDLRGLAFDAQGNLFVAGHGTNQIYKVTSDGTSVTPFGVPFGGSQFLAFEPNTLASTTTVIVPIGTVGSADITLTFPSVTVGGTTMVTPIDPPPPLPPGFELTGGDPPLAFEITTTATYTTPIIIAFQVSVDPLIFPQLRVLHNEGGTLVDRTATDPAPNPTTQTIYASVSSLSPFVIAKLTFNAQVQQPINADGTSVFNVRRGVVPVKFTLTQGGVATCALPAATIAVTRTSGGTTGAIDESVYSGSADTGSNFRISSCQYLFNLNSSALGVGTYRADIKINGTVVGSGIFQLK